MQTVGIIDDGVNNEFYDIGIIKNSIEITTELMIEQINRNVIPKNSHGTICAAILKKYYSKANIVSIKILDSEKESCRKEQLIKAIEWCIDNEIKVINMSIGSIDYRDFNQLNTVILKASEAGCVIVAACHNKNIFTMPASSQYAIGVKTDKEGKLKDNEYKYNSLSLDGIEIMSCSKHIIETIDGDTEYTKVCNSYAVPVITALVCRILDEEIKDITVEEVRGKLFEKSINFTIDISKKHDEKKGYIDKFSVCSLEGKLIDAPLIAFFSMSESYDINNVEKLIQHFREDGYFAMSISIVEEEHKDEFGHIYIKNDKLLPINKKIEILYRIYEWDLAIINVMSNNIDKESVLEINNTLSPDEIIYLLDDFRYRYMKNNKNINIYEKFLVGDKAEIYLTNKNNKKDDMNSLYMYILNNLL